MVDCDLTIDESHHRVDAADLAGYFSIGHYRKPAHRSLDEAGSGVPTPPERYSSLMRVSNAWKRGCPRNGASTNDPLMPDDGPARSSTARSR